MSSTVLVHTLGQTTDKKAQLIVVKRGYTIIPLRFLNPSSKEATYRIAHGNQKDSRRSKVGPEMKVAGSKMQYVTEYGLTAGQNYIFFLERKENGQWVEQTGGQRAYISMTTLKMDVSVSTSTEAAVLTWVKYSTRNTKADHLVYIYDKKAESGVKRVPVKKYPQSSVTTSGNTNMVTVTGLKRDKVYYGTIMVEEPTVSGDAFVAADSFEFETSDRANLTVDHTKTFATTVTMSWDEGGVGQSESDKKADFMINAYTFGNKRWNKDEKFAMGWTTEGTKTFTPEGLTPGEKYLFQLYRRGVDGMTKYQYAQHVTTKTCDMTLSNPESTRVLVKWDSVYDKADYAVTYAPADGKGPVKTRSASTRTDYRILDLIPNTPYTVGLLIKENGTYHVLKTDTFVTDKASILTQTGVNHTSVNLQVEVFHSDIGQYYVMDTTKQIKTRSFRSKIGKTSVTLNNLKIGKTYKLNLFRAEGGNWIKQKWNNNTTDYITVRSNDFLVSTSVASTSALVTWDQAESSSEYTVQIFDKVPSDKVDAKFTFSGAEVKTVDGEHVVVVSGLAKKTKYYGIISGNGTKMKEFDFVTSSAAVFRIGKYFSSYATFSWTPGDVQEADGVSEFRIQYYDYSTKKWAYAMDWQPDSNNTGVVNGLSPGVKYRFDLHRLGVDGSSRTEAILRLTMRTTKMEVESVNSQQIEVSWPAIYTNAQYQLTYTPSGGETVVFGGGPFTNTSAAISGLEEGTEYKLNLYVIENSKPVGVATASLGTASSVTTGTKTGMYGLIAAILAIVAVIAGMKMRNR